MSLIKCNECQREISDKASSCPGCGAPTQQLSPDTQVSTRNLNIVDRNKILNRELAKSGAVGGYIGGGFGGALGGALGGYIAGKFMPTELAEKEVVCSYEYEMAIVIIKATMMGFGGRAIDAQSLPSDNIITRTIGEGAFSGAQAIMSVEFVKIDQLSTRMLISCAAKDSMLRKNVAQKYIAKLLEGLNYKAV